MNLEAEIARIVPDELAQRKLVNLFAKLHHDKLLELLKKMLPQIQPPLQDTANMLITINSQLHLLKKQTDAGKLEF